MHKYIVPLILGFLPSKIHVYGSPSFLEKLEEANLTVPSDKAMSKLQVARVIVKAGFPMEVVPLITCLAEYESRFKPNAINQNTNNTRDYGLLQINSLWLAKEGCDTNVHDLLNPLKNAECAYKIYQTQGLTAWTTYKIHKKACQAYRLNEHENNDYQISAREEAKSQIRNSNSRQQLAQYNRA